MRGQKRIYVPGINLVCCETENGLSKSHNAADAACSVECFGDGKFCESRFRIELHMANWGLLLRDCIRIIKEPLGKWYERKAYANYEQKVKYLMEETKFIDFSARASLVCVCTLIFYYFLRLEIFAKMKWDWIFLFYQYFFYLSS